MKMGNLINRLSWAMGMTTVKRADREEYMSSVDVQRECRKAANATRMILDWEKLEEWQKCRIAITRQNPGFEGPTVEDAVMLWFDEIEVPDGMMLPACGVIPAREWPALQRIEIEGITVSGAGTN